MKLNYRKLFDALEVGDGEPRYLMAALSMLEDSYKATPDCFLRRFGQDGVNAVKKYTDASLTK